jgi:riboflavin transporter FmnP
MNRSKIKKLTTMGILIAISIIFILVLRVPFPPAPFLVYEPGDVPILLGGFIYGPLAGIVMTVVVSAIQALTVSGDGWIGCIMHVFATSALVGIAALVYKKHKTIKRAIIGLICGSIAMAAIMIPMNLIFYPLFANTPVDAVAKLIIPALLPFNLLKAGINSIITLLVYKSIGKFLNRITEN